MRLGSKILGGFALLVLGGCSTPIMKATPFYEGKASAYTAPVEDRVNLWPLVYNRAPATSILWPMLTFSDDHLALRPFYSQYKQLGAEDNYDEFSVLWPFCQIDTRGGEGWIFPFYWNRNRTLALPLFSLSENKDWNDLYIWPLLSSVHWSDTTVAHSWYAFCGLASVQANAEGIGRSWCFPFYYHRDNAEFWTLIYGWSDNGATRTTDCLMPLLRTWSGAKRGFRFWPFCEYSSEGDMGGLLQDVENGQMPFSLKCQTVSVTNNAHQIEKVERPLPQSVAKSSGIAFWIVDWSTRITDYLKGEKKEEYVLKKVSRGACPFAFASMEKYEQIFDCETHGKKGERLESTCNLLEVVYDSERHLDTEKKIDRSRQRILHWLWNCEENNGNVSIDMLPGYTYDRKTNGFFKTSFLWRFFRYEEEPGRSPKIDLLYVPIWR